VKQQFLTQRRLALFARRIAQRAAPSISMNVSSWRRLTQLSSLCLALILGLSACLDLGTTPSAQPTISINSPTDLSPTPTAPAYLVGAYVSNSTLTSSNGGLTVFVIFHHGQLPQAGGKVSLYFHFEDGGGLPGLNNQAGTRTTGADGFATFQISVRGVPADRPVSIDVKVSFTGIPDISKPDATSFSVVNVISTTPVTTPTGNGP
jgi:hypothetical protein